MHLTKALFSRVITPAIFVTLSFIATPVRAEYVVIQPAVDRIGEAAILAAMENTSLSKAVAYTKHFCVPSLPNKSAIRRKLKRSGYLMIGKDNEGFQMYATKSGAPVIVLSEDADFGAICGTMAQGKRVRKNTVKRALEANLKTQVSDWSAGTDLASIESLWKDDSDPGLVYGYERDGDFSIILSLRIK